jgi:hypothetical protein
MKTFDKLNSEYSKLANKLRKEIEKKVKSILKKSGEEIRFKSAVFYHLISDDIYSDLRGISIEDNTIMLKIERNIFKDIDDETETLDEAEMTSLYEVLLALEEKEFKVDTQ